MRTKFSILQVPESWAGPGNKANVIVSEGFSVLQLEILFCFNATEMGSYST